MKNLKIFIFIYMFHSYYYYILISLYKQYISNINSTYDLINNVYKGEVEIGKFPSNKILYIILAFEYFEFLLYKKINNYSFKINNQINEKINLNNIVFESYNSNENFTLKNDKEKKIYNINFKTYENITDDFIILNDGYLGLKYIQNRDSQRNNIFFQLKNKNAISYYIFFFNFKKQNKSKFIIGDYPHNIFKEYKKNYHFKEITSFISNFKWNINFFNLTILNNTFDNITADFSMNIYGIIFPYKMKKIFHDNYFDNLFLKNICSFEEFTIYKKIYYGISCNEEINFFNFVPIKFYHLELNYSFELDKNDLFTKSKNKIFFNIFFIKEENNLILGEIFIKKYLFSFNAETKKIGFYKKIHQKYDHIKFNEKIIISFLILFIFILIYIIYNMKQKKLRKQIVNELDYYYEYKSNDKKIELINNNKI